MKRWAHIITKTIILLLMVIMILGIGASNSLSLGFKLVMIAILGITGIYFLLRKADNDKDKDKDYVDLAAMAPPCHPMLSSTESPADQECKLHERS